MLAVEFEEKSRALLAAEFAFTIVSFSFPSGLTGEMGGLFGEMGLKENTGVVRPVGVDGLDNMTEEEEESRVCGFVWERLAAVLEPIGSVVILFLRLGFTHTREFPYRALHQDARCLSSMGVGAAWLLR